MFIHQFDELKNKRLSIVLPDNPFFPYRGKHFEEGLDSIDKAELHQLQEKGGCGLRVNRLVIKGFLQLYPFLKPAFLDETRGRELKSMIRSGYNPAFKRCVAHKFLNELRTRRNLADFAPIDMAAGIAFKWDKSRDGEPETDWDNLLSIHYSLGKAAFCNDYPPSIYDVMRTANMRGGMILTKDEELYLAERARFHGLLEDLEYRKIVKQTMQGTQSRQHFRDILIASRQFSLHEIEAVKGFWQPGCKEILNANLRQKR